MVLLPAPVVGSTLNFQRTVQLLRIASSNTALLQIPRSNHWQRFAKLSKESKDGMETSN